MASSDNVVVFYELINRLRGGIGCNPLSKILDIRAILAYLDYKADTNEERKEYFVALIIDCFRDEPEKGGLLLASLNLLDDDDYKKEGSSTKRCLTYQRKNIPEYRHVKGNMLYKRVTNYIKDFVAWIIKSREDATTEKSLVENNVEFHSVHLNTSSEENALSALRHLETSVAGAQNIPRQSASSGEERGLVHQPRHPNPHFVCRDEDLKKIDEFLSKDSYVILEGMGGIGKTELAKKYASEYASRYNTVQFINYRGSLHNTIAQLKFHNFDDMIYGGEDAESRISQIFAEKMRRLSLQCEDTLIIVDDFPPDDDDFNLFVGGRFKTIFTSREQHNDEEHTCEVNALKSDKDRLKLFAEYFKPKKVASNDKKSICDIIRVVHGHTMMIMLVAAAMHVGGENLLQCYKN